MKSGEKSREHIFQGYVNLLEKDAMVMIYKFSFTDPVDPALLQKAADRTLDKLDYFRLSLCGDEGDPYHVQNDRPCPVYPEGEEREIPEETNGYLFYIAYEDCSVYFHCNHFLTDGRGCYVFVSQLAREYCNARYHTAFPDMAFPEEPPLTWEELEPYFRRPSMSACDDPLAPETLRSKAQGFLLRLDKNSVIALAKEKNAKPFSCLLALFCETVQRSLGKEKFSFQYPVNARQAAGHPNALYNCVTVFTDTAAPGQEQSFDQLLAHIDGNVCKNLLPESVLRQYSQTQGILHDIYKLSVPFSIKKRIHQMAYRVVGSAFLLTFCGSLPLDDAPGLERYLTDFYLHLSIQAMEEAPMAILVTDHGGQWNLGIQHRYPNDDLPEIIRSVMEEHGIRVNEIQDIE